MCLLRLSVCNHETSAIGVCSLVFPSLRLLKAMKLPRQLATRTLETANYSFICMQTTIQDLPFELLEQIIALSVPDYDPDSPRTLTARQSFLRDCALVSRQFRCPAQAVLWSVVRVHATTTAKRLLNSPVLGMYGSSFVDLAGVHAGSEGLSGTVAGRVIAKVRGVQTLRLSDFGRLSARVLQSNSLTGTSPLPPFFVWKRRTESGSPSEQVYARSIS